ncbi:hypothetical protein ACETK8_12450 [Brevundimonas staleyi]|uniref:Terminase small subunit n=1 Tax=Brevundimonas staleyi TaxID=74326 RepID=A0ABW0FUU4_9CAUL
MIEEPHGRHSPPDDVWTRVRKDYLAGWSARDCCRRYGVGLSALRARAARDGWRRSDRPWSPPDRLDPWDEGADLELRVGGDLDKVEFVELGYIAHRRMMRAVMRGDAAEALRWRRVELTMAEVDAELESDMERFEAIRWRLKDDRADDATDPNASDSSDASDGVLESGPARSGGDYLFGLPVAGSVAVSPELDEPFDPDGSVAGRGG